MAMVDVGRQVAFPVVVFDGDGEMNVGNIRINPDLEYKSFKNILSQMIGVSLNHTSVYLVRRKNPLLPSMDDIWRISIHGNVNFGLICRQRDCYFLVDLTCIRRNCRTCNDFKNSDEFSPPQITQPEFAVLNSRTQNVRFHREGFPFAMGRRDPNPNERLGAPVCSECVEKNAGTPSFHACVRDAVVTRFATRFGPINRPIKPFPWKLYKLFPSDR